VYMQRLLCILKDPRNLKEQIALWKGEQPLVLDNYGAYYAVKYEGFKTVSPEMNLKYDADEQNRHSFNPYYQLYAMDWDRFIDLAINQLNYEMWRIVTRDKEQDEIWLINCEGGKPKTMYDFRKLRNEGQAFPYDKEKFVHPYMAFFIGKGEVRLIMEEKPRSQAENNALCFRFIGMQTSGVTVSAFKPFFEEFK